MAFPTSVNSQITDAITQTNVKVVGEAPAMAIGALYQSVAHSMALTFENASNAQQQGFTLGQAVTTSCVQALLRSVGQVDAAETTSKTAK